MNKFLDVCGPYVTELLDHGTVLEPEAIKYIGKHYVNLYGLERVLPEGGKEHSYCVDVSHLCGAPGFSLLATPDYVCKDAIVEIKCPAYNIKKGFSPKDAMFYELRRNPYGRHNHFLQSAIYAMIFDKPDFYVMKYFAIVSEGNVEDAAIMTKYTMSPQLKKFLMECIFHAFKNIHDYVEAKRIGKNKYRFKSMKDEMIRMMEYSFADQFPTLTGRITYTKAKKH